MSKDCSTLQQFPHLPQQTINHRFIILPPAACRIEWGSWSMCKLRDQMSRRGRCAKCSEPFLNEKAIFALGQLYHVNHLRCNYCDIRIYCIDKSFIINDTKIACACCFDKLSPKCQKCKRSIVSKYAINDGRLYHLHCFQCVRCHRVLDVEYFKDENGRPLDKDCFWGEVLMDHIIRDIDNIVLSKY
ncbi:Lipoma-preferred partner [Dirofilaria immitis]|nr:Transforming growth factor beta-1-induced transcript 1 protein [Dirofilaria immitis]